MTRRGVRRLVLAVAGAVAVGAGLPAPALGATAATGRIDLAGHNPWVGAGGAFELRLRADSRDPDDVEIAVTVYPAVANRSEFARSLEDRVRGSAISVNAIPLDELAPSEDGTRAVTIPLQDPALPRDRERVSLRAAGVYPVAVELRGTGGGDVADRFTTHLVYLPDVIDGPRLGVALVLPVAAEPSFTDEGAPGLTDADAVALDALAAALERHRGVAATVAPVAQTLQAMDDSSRQALAGALAGRHVLDGPYVRLPLPAYRDAAAEAERQYERGHAQLTAMLPGVDLDRSVAVADTGVDADAVARLRAAGVGRLVVPERELAPIPLRTTLTQPFVLETRPSLPAAIADPGLDDHFSSREPVLRAHQLLADLAVLYFDSPGRVRGVIALPPRTWRPSAALLGPLLAGLEQHPVVEAMSVRQLFGSVPPAPGTRSNRPLVRRLATGSDPPPLPIAAIRETRRQLAAFESMLGPSSEVGTALNDRLLAAQSADFSARQRDAAVRDVRQAMSAELAAIRVPANRAITLTARRGEIPVSVRRDSSYPVTVVVRLFSDKLRFPVGSSARLDLTRRNTTRRFTVQAVSSGTFPLDVVVTSPDGALTITEGTFTVRSRAVSGVGVAVTVAALIFLVVWWGRHVVRTRRT